MNTETCPNCLKLTEIEPISGEEWDMVQRISIRRGCKKCGYVMTLSTSCSDDDEGGKDNIILYDFE